MTDTLEPTVERLRHTFQAVADQVVDAPPVFHAVPVAVAALDDTGAEVTVVDIGRTRYARTRRARWLAAAAALVAVLLVAATVLVTGAGEHVRRKPAAPGPAPTTVTPGTVLPLAHMMESELGLDLPGEPDASIGAVAVGGPGLVAVGSVGADGADRDDGYTFSDHDAAVWTSADGQAWSRVPDDEAVFGGPGFQGMSDVVVGGPGFVAVGRDGSLVEPDSHAVAAVWTSPDGISWSRVAHDDAVFGSATGEPNDIFKMTAVTTGGPGLVAIGERWKYHALKSLLHGGPSAATGDRAVGAVWTSTDGVTWSLVPHDPAVFGHWPTTSPYNEPAGWGLSASMRDITPGRPGLVVVGDIYRGGSTEGLLEWSVWTSPDGLRWTRTAEQIEGSISAVTEGGPGLVAVGSADFDVTLQTTNAAVWTSPDGTTWTRVPSQADVLDGPVSQWMVSVAAGGPGLVATGAGGGPSDDALTVWTSVDGITWSRASDQAPPDAKGGIETVLRLYGFDGSPPGALPDRPGALAPATGLIAFVGEDGAGNGSEIYVVAADGTGLRALTSTPDDPYVGEMAPAWSRDRRRLAFLRRLPGGGDTQLVVMDPATGEKQLEDRIPLGPQAGAMSVAWSPDGRFIIVHVANDGPAPVIMDLEKETWIRMSPEAPVTAWSPDGNWLLVQPCTGPPQAWCEDDEPLLVPADALGTDEVFSYRDLPGVRPLLAQDATNEWPDGFWAPTWHPGGSSVAITTHRDPTIDRYASAPDETSIHVLSIADGRLREVIRDGYSPAWSPDGAEIAYLRRGARGAEIWVAGADGSLAHFVANTLTPPAWSPDGSSLVGLAPDGLFTVRPDGTGYAVLISFPRLVPDVATQLGSAVMGTGMTMAIDDLNPDW